MGSLMKLVVEPASLVPSEIKAILSFVVFVHFCYSVNGVTGVIHFQLIGFNCQTHCEANCFCSAASLWREQDHARTC